MGYEASENLEAQVPDPLPDHGNPLFGWTRRVSVYRLDGGSGNLGPHVKRGGVVEKLGDQSRVRVRESV